jgi:hypothetical protein
MGVDWTDDALLEVFARQKVCHIFLWPGHFMLTPCFKGGNKSDFNISLELSAKADDKPAPPGNIGVAIKSGRTDGGAEIGWAFRFAESENKIHVGNCSRYQNATVKFFSNK